MKVYFNPDREVAEKIREKMIEKGGYCPCRIQRTDDNKCMCKEFREQIADADFEGFCHCRLYFKEK